MYHLQKMEGNITDTIRRLLPNVSHIQIADNPGRHEPGTGEINCAFLLNEIEKVGYEGLVGLEYVPLNGTESSFKWAKEQEIVFEGNQ